MDLIDSKYINLVSSRLDKFKRVKPNLFNFRCPLCGDSQKHKNKARGYFYQVKTNTNYKCHNSGASMSFNNYLKKIDLPGDNIEFEDLTLDFIVDENLENYLEIHNWIYGLGYPESISEFQELITQSDGQKDVKEQFSDGTLSILNRNFNVSTRVKFRDLFPISLSSLEFTATENDYTYFTATATFKYLFYTIEVDT